MNRRMKTLLQLGSAAIFVSAGIDVPAKEARTAAQSDVF